MNEKKILIRSNRSWFLLKRGEIEWIEAQGENTVLHCGSRQYSISAGMSSIERELKHQDFVRIHRSYIVNVDSIREIKPLQERGYAVVLNDGTELKWSRRFIDRLQSLQKSAPSFPKKYRTTNKLVRCSIS